MKKGFLFFSFLFLFLLILILIIFLVKKKNSKFYRRKRCKEKDYISKVCALLALKRPFYQSFKLFLQPVINSLVDPLVQARSKSLNVLTQVITVDPLIFNEVFFFLFENFLFLWKMKKEINK